MAKKKAALVANDLAIATVAPLAKIISPGSSIVNDGFTVLLKGIVKFTAPDDSVQVVRTDISNPAAVVDTPISCPAPSGTQVTANVPCPGPNGKYLITVQIVNNNRVVASDSLIITTITP